MTSPDSSLPAPKGGEPARGGEPRAPRLARPQPKPKGEAGPADAETGVGSGSATGFVSMLAKRQFDADALAATANDEAARRERVAMAREIQAKNTPPEKETSEEDAPPPAWHRFVMPVAIVLALSLLGIGGWAIGALIYMHQVSPLAPSQVHYPLISWRLDIGSTGDYTQASRLMAWGMLACIPIAFLLILMASLLRRRNRPHA